MTARRIVVTGGTGFIGSHVLRELARRPVEVRAVTRGAAGTRGAAVTRGAAGTAPAEGVSWVRASVEEPETLRGVFDGADAVLHLAGYVGRDETRCEAVNARGGAAVAGAAREAGVGRTVCLSTAAVYGPGPHRGVDVDEVPPAPVSAASRTRLAAEAAFLASGACVLRAGLVLGAGDRWVVPALAELVRRVPARWDGGRGLLSVVAAADLARLIADVACSDRPWPAQVHHAAHPRPVRCGDLMRELARHGLVPEVEEKLSWEQCREQLRRSPGDVTERQFSLLAQDHWFRSDRVWRLASCDPGPGPLARLGDAAPWYRARLAGAGREAVSG